LLFHAKYAMIYYIYVDMVWKNIRNLVIFNK